MGLTDLTARQAELARQLHSGKSRAEICTAMGITSNTLQNYLKAIYMKLGIGTVAQLVLIVERAQLEARVYATLTELVNKGSVLREKKINGTIEWRPKA